jgi:hypothetical protein
LHVFELQQQQSAEYNVESTQVFLFDLFFPFIFKIYIFFFTKILYYKYCVIHLLVDLPIFIETIFSSLESRVPKGGG